jgi:hypothetical protein
MILVSTRADAAATSIKGVQRTPSSNFDAIARDCHGYAARFDMLAPSHLLKRSVQGIALGLLTIPYRKEIFHGFFTQIKCP